MKIQYVQGDMFASDIATIVHGCNAQGRMGSGVAKLIKTIYPAAYDAYMRAFDQPRQPKVGDVVWAEVDGKTIANAITQEFYGSDGARYVSYEGVRRAFRTINAVIAGQDDKRLCMPLIGAGLGGGSWPTIAAIIEEECTHTQPVVYTLDGVIPA